MATSSPKRSTRGRYVVLVVGCAALLSVCLLLNSGAGVEGGPTSVVPARKRTESDGMAYVANANYRAKPPGRFADSTSVDKASRPQVRRAIRRAPPEIEQVFPSIRDAVGDWRRFRPDSLTVAPYPDLHFTFDRAAMKDEGRYVTWIGRNLNLPGASFVGVATANGYDAILVVPGSSQFSFHVRGDNVVVEETFPGEESCGVEPVQIQSPRRLSPRLA